MMSSVNADESVGVMTPVTQLNSQQTAQQPVEWAQTQPKQTEEETQTTQEENNAQAAAPVSTPSSPAAEVFDPARSSTPAESVSPVPMERATSSTSDQQQNQNQINPNNRMLSMGQKHLPILSLPALPGQRVCACMSPVVETAQTSTPTKKLTNQTTDNSLTSPPTTQSHSITLDRILSLQDRFWLSVGEVALHNDDCGVERGVDSMETLAVKLSHLSQQLAHTIAFLRDQQLQGVAPLMVELERKNSELVDTLKATRGEEQLIRDRIDVLATQVEKAKKTVTMGGTLGLNAAKQAREQSYLDTVRRSRDSAQKQLELIVTNRTMCQNQMLNVSTIAAECRITEMDKRDYKLMYKQVQSHFFHRSFGSSYQSQVDTLIKLLAKYREQSHECARRQKFIEQTIQEIRARIALVVAAYWK